MIYCSSCGNVLQQDAFFCHECGTKTENAGITVDILKIESIPVLVSTPKQEPVITPLTTVVEPINLVGETPLVETTRSVEAIQPKVIIGNEREDIGSLAKVNSKSDQIIQGSQLNYSDDSRGNKSILNESSVPTTNPDDLSKIIENFLAIESNYNSKINELKYENISIDQSYFNPLSLLKNQHQSQIVKKEKAFSEYSFAEPILSSAYKENTNNKNLASYAKVGIIILAVIILFAESWKIGIVGGGILLFLCWQLEMRFENFVLFLSSYQKNTFTAQEIDKVKIKSSSLGTAIENKSIEERQSILELNNELGRIYVSNEREAKIEYDKKLSIFKRKESDILSELNKITATNINNIKTQIVSIAGQLNQLPETFDNKPVKWSDSYVCKGKDWVAPNIRIGEDTVSININKAHHTINVPRLIPFLNKTNLVFNCNNTDETKEAIRVSYNLIARTLLSLPVSKIKITFIDPLELGGNAAPFTPLLREIYGGMVFTQQNDIENQLSILTRAIENVIQRYLQNQYEDIAAYNKKNNEVPEPYRLLVIYNFPHGFNDTTANKLFNIIKSGPKAGINTILVNDKNAKLPYGMDWKIFDSVNIREIIVSTPMNIPSSREEPHQIEEVELSSDKPIIGNIYECIVKSIVPFGAFVEFLPGKEGLIHISEVSEKRLETMDGVLKLGDKIKAKLLGADTKSGKFKLSIKSVFEIDGVNNTPKETNIFICQKCGVQSKKWIGQCASCNEWNTFVEKIITDENDNFTGLDGSKKETEMLPVFSESNKKNKLEGLDKSIESVRMFGFDKNLPFTEIVDYINKELPNASSVKVLFKLPPKTDWWQDKAHKRFAVPIGKHALEDQFFSLNNDDDNQALLIGKPGSGKSNLLHTIISNSLWKYSPDQLEIYLIDFKGGVEFTIYADKKIPHIRTIAIESEREFGLSVLDGVERELLRRENEYSKTGVQNIEQYHEKFPTERMPRVLLIVDEFQEFYAEDDNIKQAVDDKFDRIVRKGRAFGINTLFSSQTLSGNSIKKSTKELIDIRMALMCSDLDSNQILDDRNPAARDLTRPGEGIYNSENGKIEGNRRFQAFFVEKEDLIKTIESVVLFADSQENGNKNFKQIIFRGSEKARLQRSENDKHPVETIIAASNPKSLRLWVGEPVAIAEDVTAVLRKQGGSNLLVAGYDENIGLRVMCSSIISITAQQQPNSCTFYSFNFYNVDSEFVNVPNEIFNSIKQECKIINNKQVKETLQSIKEEIEIRHSGSSGNNPNIYLTFFSLQRGRAFRKDGYSMSDEGNLLAYILKEGADVGVYSLVQVDTMDNFSKNLDDNLLKEFSQRVASQMNPDNSVKLIGNQKASKLGSNRAWYYDDNENSLIKFKPYELPAYTWISQLQKPQSKLS